jgi:hypothetical protein
MSLKERFIIPKRKEPQEPYDHHHRRHHHHHSSKYSYEENNYRSSLTTRSPMAQLKPIERYNGRRSFIVRDLPRTQEQQLSKDERRKLFEQQYEDEEKVGLVVNRICLVLCFKRQEQRQQQLQHQPMVKVQVRIFSFILISFCIVYL